MTKVTIISGFLGAGKTTFIRKLLEQVYTGEKIVLIENEYGEIGIDGSFLKDSGIEITEMNSGCICCTLVGDFTDALKKVIEQFNPDRIIIEPSGVGKLSDVVAAVEKVKAFEELEITEKIAVVDAKKAKIYMKNFGEFFKNQVHYASTIVLSRTQFLTEEKLEEVTELLRTENADAPLITTPWTDLSAEAVLHALEHSDVTSILDIDDDDDECCCHHHHHDEDEDEQEHEHEHEHHHHHHDDDDDECCCHHHHHDEDEDEHEHHHHHHDDDDDDDECCCHHHHDDDEDEHEHHHHHHHHHADDIFDSWGRETAKKFTAEEFDHILAELKSGTGYGTILRSKGIVCLSDGSWKQFDLVPEEDEIRSCAPDYTGRICVIGCQLDEKKLEALFGL